MDIGPPRRLRAHVARVPSLSSFRSPLDPCWSMAFSATVLPVFLCVSCSFLRVSWTYNYPHSATVLNPGNGRKCLTSHAAPTGTQCTLRTWVCLDAASHVLDPRPQPSVGACRSQQNTALLCVDNLIKLIAGIRDSAIRGSAVSVVGELQSRGADGQAVKCPLSIPRHLSEVSCCRSADLVIDRVSGANPAIGLRIERQSVARSPVTDYCFRAGSTCEHEGIRRR